MEFLWDVPLLRSQGGVCGPKSHELLDATHGGVVDLFANVAWTQIPLRAGVRSLIWEKVETEYPLCLVIPLTHNPNIWNWGTSPFLNVSFFWGYDGGNGTTHNLMVR